MACTQTLSGIVRDCLNNMGGIIEVYIANADDVASITFSGGGDDEIMGITMAASAKFHRYALRRNSGALTSNFTVDAVNGIAFVTNDILMQFSRMDTTKRVEVMALVQADTIAMVKDANGNVWMVGDSDHPLNLGDGSLGQTGQASTDRNGYDVHLTNEQPHLPYLVYTGAGGVDLSTIVA